MIGKVMVTVTEPQENYGGPKARNDINQLAATLGYTIKNVVNPPSITKKLLFLNHFLTGKTKKMFQYNDVDTIVFQYAAYCNFTTNIAIKALKKYNPHARFVLFIHDIAALRYGFKRDLKREIKLFNQADVLIVHNSRMAKWLLQNKVNVPMVNLEIFDYLSHTTLKSKTSTDHSIVFAGNLAKSSFLTKAALHTKFTLYGPNPSDSYPANLTYKGQMKPDELPLHLNQRFGLVWDGDSLHECSGKMGHYQMYNDPHKVSLYLSSGIPVIIWSQAAMADFIKKHDVGLVVDDLTQLDSILASLSQTDYQRMKTNTIKLASKLRQGYFTKKALKAAELIPIKNKAKL